MDQASEASWAHGLFHIGKACCGGDKKWGDGRGAGCPKHPHYNCHACGKLLPKMPIDDDFDHNGELDHLFESLGGMRSLAVCMSCAAVVVCACMGSLGVPVVVKVRN